MNIRDLYGAVDNLECFVHPSYKRRFSFMSDDMVLDVARIMADKIKDSCYKSIVVSETGATLLANICEELVGDNAEWTYIKFPREPVDDIFPVLNFYLTKEESEEHVSGRPRGEALLEICSNIPNQALLQKKRSLDDIFKGLCLGSKNKWQEEVSSLFEGTRIANVLRGPFIYFDEYITSGTTLQNAETYFGYLAKSPEFKTLSYYLNTDRGRHERVLFSLFDRKSQLECFSKGAYPFENRIDLVGHYYNPGRSFRKTYIQDIRLKYAEAKQETSGLLECLSRNIGSLSDVVRKNSAIRDVASFISKEHMMRYFLFKLEDASYTNEFLWQLFEMYAPAWYPLPIEYHIGFMNAFRKCDDAFECTKEMRVLYAESRGTVLKEISAECIKRRENWLKRLSEMLGGRND
ncbi:MAG: hypothetical protein ABIB71_08065 [Candidatus Woesearchaeota archaeon]